MKQFNERSRCPKCGKDGATATFHNTLGVERIARVCSRCGYEWNEKPLDAKEEAQP